MQFSIITIAFFAAVISAAPTNNQMPKSPTIPTTSTPPPAPKPDQNGNCANGAKTICCNNILGLLSCTLQSVNILGNAGCGGTTYCCGGNSGSAETSCGTLNGNDITVSPEVLS